jgi:chemotaxis protein histidine kinase CheA
LGELVIEKGIKQVCPIGEVEFDITHNPTKISVVEELKGKKGYLYLQKLNIDSFEHEEYLLFSGFDDSSHSIDQEICQKLFNCSGVMKDEISPAETVVERLQQEAQRHSQSTIAKSLEENSQHFHEARNQLEKWAEDMVIAVEKELADTKAQIKLLNRQARQAPTMAEQKPLQEQIQQLGKKKRKQRQQIFDIEDEITGKRDALIEALERRMTQKTTIEPLFTLRWSVV